MRSRFHVLLSLLLALAMAATLVAGCGDEAEDTDTTPAEEPKTDITAAMVTDTNGLGDKSFNDAAWAGLQQAEKELGVAIKVLESNEAADYEPNIDELASAGYDIIFPVGFFFQDISQVKAEQYPDITFGAIDQFFETPLPNVEAVTFRENEGAYLAGIVAGLATLDSTVSDRINDQNVIAFVGGADIPPVEKYQAGFIAGARSVNPDVEVISAFIGNFDDQTKAKELALSAIDGGADIVFGVAGLAGLGVIPACQEAGALFIGVDADQYVSAPESQDIILTSALKDLQTPVFDIIKAVVDGTFAGGTNASYGIAENAGGIAPYHNFEDKISADIKNAVSDAEAGIVDGTLTVPTTRAELGAL